MKRDPECEAIPKLPLTVCILMVIAILAGCGTTVGKLNPALTSIIPDAKLKGPQYNDGIVQNVERKAIIKRYGCRTYLLRKKKLPKECK